MGFCPLVIDTKPTFATELSSLASGIGKCNRERRVKEVKNSTATWALVLNHTS